jgi:hypothetical protein
MEEEIFKYITNHQLSSCMNNTKWKELVSELTSIECYEPLVNIKLIFDNENNNDFSHVWWDEVERDGFELIEWIQIKPFKIEKVGRLIEPKKTDFTEFVKKALDKHNIPYNYGNEVFTVQGYKRMK